jgi:hypothetical protein
MSGPAASAGWVVISDSPRWPSPYFTELERHSPPTFPLGFAPTLDDLPASPSRPGVVNLHRLKCLTNSRTESRR